MAHHICPWWMGYWLINPLRRLVEPPRRILGAHLEPGMTVLDVGCGMGFFSLEAARLVAPAGRVVCVDQQARMLATLQRRARKANLAPLIIARACAADSLGIGDLKGQVDFALAVHVAHEVPDGKELFTQIRHALKPAGRLLLAEPCGHVSGAEFANTVSVAVAAGFERLSACAMRRSRSILLAAATLPSCAKSGGQGQS